MRPLPLPPELARLGVQPHQLLEGAYLDLLRGWLTFQDPKQFLQTL